MEAIHTAATESGVPEEILSEYAALWQNIVDIPFNESSNAYKNWLDKAELMGSAIGAVVEAQKELNEHLDKAVADYDYMAQITQAISAAQYRAEKANYDFDRAKDKGYYTTYTEDGIEKTAITTNNVLDNVSTNVGALRDESKYLGENNA
jgi:hypothetical protein